jgi:hypothetical protein
MAEYQAREPKQRNDAHPKGEPRLQAREHGPNERDIARAQHGYGSRHRPLADALDEVPDWQPRD